MFSDAISSISWRCRPSSPRIAAAISGSASVSVAVKNESDAEAVLILEALALEDEELMSEISPPPQPVTGIAVGPGWRSEACWRDTTSGRNGQALAVHARYLCKIWWGYQFSPSCSNSPPPCGEGSGVGVTSRGACGYPPPQPSPARGGGEEALRRETGSPALLNAAVE